jgi:hypothetical protein
VLTARTEDNRLLRRHQATLSSAAPAVFHRASMLCVVIDGRKCEWVSAMLGAIDDWSSHAGGCISTRVNKPENDDASILNEEPG